MAITLLQYQKAVLAPDGSPYEARACGGPMPGGTWEGWIEFVPLDGGEPVRSPRETTQPNRTDTEYWATGLTQVYLEGSLARALDTPIGAVAPPPPQPSMFSGPAPRLAPPDVVYESVLNPFSVYEKGEALLRRQLGALSAWHLVNIIRDYELSSQSPDVLQLLTPPVLVETIVNAVKARAENGRRSDSETVVS
jgi:hypothetical protein